MGTLYCGPKSNLKEIYLGNPCVTFAVRKQKEKYGSWNSGGEEYKDENVWGVKRHKGCISVVMGQEYM